MPAVLAAPGPLILWHVATAVAAVAAVFGDPRFDYRLLLVGSVLPMLDAVTGGRWIMHTLMFSVALVVVVMLATIGRREVRRRWLALPIGTLLYLVFSASWNDAATFWWPAGGWSALGDQDVPFVGRPWVVTAGLEVAGLALVMWGWRRARLSEQGRREDLLREGHLDFVVN